MASPNTWISLEMEKGILLSETEENGIVTRTYIAPLLELEKVENPDPVTLPRQYPMPFFCPLCGNGIGSSGAFTMHLRACQRRQTGVHRKENLPAKFQPQLATRGHVKLEKSYPDVKPWRKPFPRPSQCIFCSKEIKVQLEHGQARRRYACDDCGQKARAEEAERKKHPKVMRQALVCDRCGKQYKLEGFLVRHQMICQGFNVKRKREYEIHKIHEIKKMKCEEKDEVTEAQLNDEIEKLFEIKLEDDTYKTNIKSEKECHDDS